MKCHVLFFLRMIFILLFTAILNGILWVIVYLEHHFASQIPTGNIPGSSGSAIFLLTVSSG